MNGALKKQIQAYLAELGQGLPDGYPNKRQILDRLQHDLHNFTEEHPGTEFADIIAEFGSVSELTDSFLNELSEAELHAAFQKKQRRRNLLLCLCVLFVIGFFCICNYIRCLYDNVVVSEDIYLIIGTETIDSETAELEP